jgi:molybdopterin/thiamine biosynthesis adenylyltransferase
MDTPSPWAWKGADLATAFAALETELGQSHRPTELGMQQVEAIAATTGAPLRVVEGFALERGLIPARYAGNIGTFTIPGQEKLLRSKVLVAGLGGLGGYVIEHLARAGIGYITGVDPDVFEEHNLNRQIGSTVSTLGNKKTLEASRRLRQVNPAVEFSGYDVKFQHLAGGVFRDVSLVFDCLDTGEDRIELAEKCAALNLPLVHGAIGGWFGQVGMCWPGTNLIQRLYRNRTQGVEQDLGNPPYTPALAASWMAAKGIRFLLGKLLPREPSLHFFDLLAEEWETIGS